MVGISHPTWERSKQSQGVDAAVTTDQGHTYRPEIPCDKQISSLCRPLGNDRTDGGKRRAKYSCRHLAWTTK